MSDNKQQNIDQLMEIEDKQLDEEIRRLLIRVFKKAAHKAWAEGNKREFQKWTRYLQEAREL